MYAVFAEEYTHDGIRVDAWLESFDLEANGGRGVIHFTRVRTRAMQFPSVAEAVSVLSTVPRFRPGRADGAPNRPLRAFTVRLDRLPEDAA